MEGQKIIIFHDSKIRAKMTVGKAKETGRRFYFYDPELGFCAPASVEDPEPVAGHKVKDYLKDNPLTPDREFTTDMKVTGHRRLFSNENNTSDLGDYSKNNPLSPEKGEEDSPDKDEDYYYSDNPLSPHYKEKKTVQKSPLAP
jgi:hypothetical protein